MHCASDTFHPTPFVPHHVKRFVQFRNAASEEKLQYIAVQASFYAKVSFSNVTAIRQLSLPLSMRRLVTAWCSGARCQYVCRTRPAGTHSLRLPRSPFVPGDCTAKVVTVPAGNTGICETSEVVLFTSGSRFHRALSEIWPNCMANFQTL